MDSMINSEMSEYWNGAGGKKWVGLHEKTNEFIMPLGQNAIDLAAIEEGELVLDIGCGCGKTSFDIANIVGQTGHVNGLDISRVMINEARAHKRLSGVKNVTFQCADAQSLELEAMLYDLVYSRFGVMFFDDPIAAFSNIRSSLDKTGRLAFTCWQSPLDNQWISLPLSIVLKYIPPVEQTDMNAPGPFAFADAQRVSTILNTAGFSNIQVSPYKTPVTFGHNIADAAHALTQLGPAANSITNSELDAETTSKILNDLQWALEPYVTDNGIMLGAATWVVTAENSLD